MPFSATDNVYLKNTEENIIFLKNYVLALETRLALLKEGYSTKSDYDKNEVRILNYETLAKISHTKTKIAKLEYKYTSELNQFLVDLKDIDDNFDNLVDESLKKKEEDINLRHFLHSANWYGINNDICQKISFFKQLKSFLI